MTDVLANPGIRTAVSDPTIKSGGADMPIEYECPRCGTAPWAFCTDDGKPTVLSHHERRRGLHWSALKGRPIAKDKYETWDSWPVIAKRHGVTVDMANKLSEIFLETEEGTPYRPADNTWPRSSKAASVYRRTHRGMRLGDAIKASGCDWTEKRAIKLVTARAEKNKQVIPYGLRSS